MHSPRPIASAFHHLFAVGTRSLRLFVWQEDLCSVLRSSVSSLRYVILFLVLKTFIHLINLWWLDRFFNRSTFSIGLILLRLLLQLWRSTANYYLANECLWTCSFCNENERLVPTGSSGSGDQSRLGFVHFRVALIGLRCLALVLFPLRSNVLTDSHHCGWPFHSGVTHFKLFTKKPLPWMAATVQFGPLRRIERKGLP